MNQHPWYYILALNYNTNQYDRCYSINMDNNQHNKRLIMTRIRNEEESYWEIEPFENDSSKIRLKSKNTSPKNISQSGSLSP